MKPFLDFAEIGTSKSKKTKVFAVRSLSAEDGSNLGLITWFPHWRKYTFYPAPATTFDPSCLREIADFCEKKTIEHKETK